MDGFDQLRIHAESPKFGEHIRYRVGLLFPIQGDGAVRTRWWCGGLSCPSAMHAVEVVQLLERFHAGFIHQLIGDKRGESRLTAVH